MFDMFISAFSSACSMEALVANFIGVALGIVFGALPGLTAVMGVALLIPLTFGFPAVIAFSALLGMYCGAIYAGSITAILVGTPGTAAAAATMLEGPKFTARGESLKALEMTTIASFIGGIFSCIVLATVAPQLAHFALDFSAPEYFSLGIFGLTIVATLSEGALLKGCIAALLGMLISMIGMDPLSGNLRMTFDSPDLINGVSLVPALVGLYALSQVLVTIEDVFMGRKLSTAEISRKGISLPDLWANRAALIRGSLFGTFIGIVPATGSGTASGAAYSAPKRHIEHGSGNSVGGVFRHGLHSRTDNSVTVKAFCVTADYHRNRLTCLLRLIFRKSVMDFHALVPEAACRHKIIAHNAFDGNAKYQVYFIADHQQRQRYTR